jgi:hypothetical protein
MGDPERSPDQAETRWRPLIRRRLMTARPARVRMRDRKPCLRLRRRTFGWYVRFMREDPFGRVGSSPIGYEPAPSVVKGGTPRHVCSQQPWETVAKRTLFPRKKEIVHIGPRNAGFDPLSRTFGFLIFLTTQRIWTCPESRPTGGDAPFLSVLIAVYGRSYTPSAGWITPACYFPGFLRWLRPTCFPQPVDRHVDGAL